MPANDLLDGWRYEIANRLPTRNPVSDIGRGNVDHAADARVGRGRDFLGPVENHELDVPIEILEAMPGPEPGQLICSQEQNEFSPGILGGDALDRVDGIRWGRAFELALVQDKPGFICKRGLQHLEAPRDACGSVVRFMRRDRRRNENDSIKPKALQRLAGKDEMAVVHGIEGAAVKTDFFQGRQGSASLHADERGLRRASNLHESQSDLEGCATMREPLGQLILTGVPGKELTAADAKLFEEVQPGGFILFGRNIESASQLRRLIDDLRGLSEVEPIITIDQEGGRVSRLRLIGNEPPNAQQLREKGDVALVKRHGRITAGLLRLFGFNLDLCPVLDLSFDDEADNSLRGRCYGRSVEEAVRLGGAFNDALRAGGVASCGKHFPGYTAAQVDAHHDLPRIDRTREELERDELAVFRQMAGRVDSMMICHAWYPTFDAERTPASFSRRIVHELLREDIGFDGLVMTDDLDMGAIYNDYPLDETIRRAIGAGNDLAMICHRIQDLGKVHAALKSLPRSQVESALARILKFKQRLAPPDDFSQAAFRQLDDEVWDLRVAVLGEKRAAERSPEDGKRSPVETY